jgi:hypothetical protein
MNIFLKLTVGFTDKTQDPMKTAMDQYYYPVQQADGTITIEKLDDQSKAMQFDSADQIDLAVKDVFGPLIKEKYADTLLCDMEFQTNKYVAYHVLAAAYTETQFKRVAVF